MKALSLKHARRRFSAIRDENGVPHISASSWRGALYGLGYLHSVDRPTQMLFSRAVAQGRAAEKITDTPELVETDRFFRRAGLFLSLDREVSQLDDSTFDQLTAYCEGVNDGMKEAGRSLPMWATGFVPTPWTQESVLLVGHLLSFGGLVVSQLQNERILIDLIKIGIADDKMRALFHPSLDEADFALLRQIRVSSQLSDEALELITDLPRLAGSNAWAVSPGRSQSGAALFASDPHLEVNRLPAIWYEAVLRWGEHEYVMGATLPGCPLFAVARNHQLAWGVTYLKGDTADYFIEDCRPGGNTCWQYRRGDRWHDFKLRNEVIERKGHGSEVVPVLYNEQGTLETDPGTGNAGLLSVHRLDRPRRRGRRVRSHPGSTWRRRTPWPTRWISCANVRCRRCAGYLPIAKGTSASKPMAGFPAARKNITGCCRFRPGTSATTGRDV